MAKRGEQDADRPALTEISPSSNVLLLAPSLGGWGDEMCLDLLSRTPPGETNILSITYTDTPKPQNPKTPYSSLII
jgi:hypothetical protein